MREYEIQAFGQLQGEKVMMYLSDCLTASKTAKILSINRNTINAYFNEFRVKTLENSIKEHSKEFAVFEHNVRARGKLLKLLWGKQNSLKKDASKTIFLSY